MSRRREQLCSTAARCRRRRRRVGRERTGEGRGEREERDERSERANALPLQTDRPTPTASAPPPHTRPMHDHEDDDDHRERNIAPAEHSAPLRRRRRPFARRMDFGERERESERDNCSGERGASDSEAAAPRPLANNARRLGRGRGGEGGRARAVGALIADGVAVACCAVALLRVERRRRGAPRRCRRHRRGAA